MGFADAAGTSEEHVAAAMRLIDVFAQAPYVVLHIAGHHISIARRARFLVGGNCASCVQRRIRC